MSIELIAINYGEPRYGRSCANCNYLDTKTMGYECGLHCLPTSLSKCCGEWSNDKRPEPWKETQKELF